MFRLGRMGKMVIAAQVGMKLFRMARAAKAKRDERKMMDIAPHRFSEADKAGIHKR
jgi:hypothetical protein